MPAINKGAATAPPRDPQAVAREKKIDRVYFRPSVEVKGAIWKARVFSLGLHELQAVLSHTSTCTQIVAALTGLRGKGQEQFRATILGTALPLLASEGIDLVASTVTFTEPEGMTMQDVPHWELPLLLDAFIQHNFGEERKWRPWVAAVESWLSRITGEAVSILGTPSNSSAKPATASATSSPADGAAGPTEAGP